MYYRTIRNDIRKNKAITVTIILFVTAAAMLVSLAAILVVNLAGAIDALMTQAKTPHFMQMHSGEIDLARLSAFAAQQGEVVDYQVVEFLNIDGGDFVFPERTLAGTVQDNGLTVQNTQFDYLLDLDGNLIQAADGEIYVPIPYMQDGLAVVGDTVIISGKEFTVAGFLRDSQMNALLSSSKRFLVSERDFAALRERGRVEYLIEFRLTAVSAITAFQTAYTTAGLEANGPTITYPLFRMLNGLSDGLMIAVILLVSALVVAIALLCIRFTLLAKIEEDYREIGVLKAIGLRVADIKKIYLVQYTAVAAFGSILGLALSFALRGIVLENIRLYMGESENASVAILFGIIGVAVVFLAIIAYVNSVLNRFRNISPAVAVRFGLAPENPAGARLFRLSTNRVLGTNTFLGIRDVLARKKIYATMLVVLVIAAFIIIVPQNLHHTISSDAFVTYMGIGNSDLRFDIQQTDNIAAKAAEIAAVLQHDSDVSRFVVLTTQTFTSRRDDGTEERIKVELGDHSLFPLTYSAGRAPAADNEIALSALNADEMGKKVGDMLPVIIAGREENLTVSGIYSDVTNGGKTAKAVFRDPSAEIMWSVITVEMVNGALVDAKVAAYADRFSFAKVSSMNEYIEQTYGTTINSIGLASYTAVAVALTMTILITLLFMKMLIVKDRYAIAVMKAFGFTNTDIQVQYVARSLFILTAGVLLGTLLANTLGERLAGSVIAMFGAATFDFVVNPLTAYVLCPLMMAGTVLAATYFGTRHAGQIEIFENIRE